MSSGWTLLTESRSGEHWIRPNTGAIEGFAFLHRFGPYDEKVLGVSRTELLRETIVPMTRYLVTTHVTGVRPTSDGKPRGDAWQSAHWIYEQGRRRVVVDGQGIEVASGCGQPWQWETAGRIKVDDAFEIVSLQALPAAYLAAKGPERGRVTDRIILNYPARRVSDQPRLTSS